MDFSEEWSSLLGDNATLDHLEKCCFSGRLRDSRVRSIVWRVRRRNSSLSEVRICTDTAEGVATRPSGMGGYPEAEPRVVRTGEAPLHDEPPRGNLQHGPRAEQPPLSAVRGWLRANRA